VRLVTTKCLPGHLWIALFRKKSIKATDTTNFDDVMENSCWEAWLEFTSWEAIRRGRIGSRQKHKNWSLITDTQVSTYSTKSNLQERTFILDLPRSDESSGLNDNAICFEARSALLVMILRLGCERSSHLIISVISGKTLLRSWWLEEWKYKIEKG